MNKLLANALASSTQMNVTRKGFEILYTVVFVNKPCFSFTVSLSDKRHTHCGNNYSDVLWIPKCYAVLSNIHWTATLSLPPIHCHWEEKARKGIVRFPGTVRCPASAAQTGKALRSTNIRWPRKAIPNFAFHSDFWFTFPNWSLVLSVVHITILFINSPLTHLCIHLLKVSYAFCFHAWVSLLDSSMMCVLWEIACVLCAWVLCNSGNLVWVLSGGIWQGLNVHMLVQLVYPLFLFLNKIDMLLAKIKVKRKTSSCFFC